MDQADTRTLRIVTIAILTTMVTALLIIGYHSAQVASPEPSTASPADPPSQLGRSSLAIDLQKTAP